MKASEIHISINIISGYDDLEIYKTVRFLLDICDKNNAGGIFAEINLPIGSNTKEYIGSLQYDKRINCVAVSNTQQLIKLQENSKGKYVLFCKGGDFFTYNFLIQAYTKAEQSNNAKFVYYPQYQICFDGGYDAFNTSTASASGLLHRNVYPLLLIRRSTVDELIANSRTISSNAETFLWQMSAELVANNYHLLSIPNSSVFTRNYNYQIPTLVKSSLFSAKNFLLHTQNQLFSDENTFEEYQHVNKKEPVSARIRSHINTDSALYMYSREQYALNRKVAKKLVNMLKVKRVESKHERDRGARSTVPYFDDETIREWAMLNKFEPIIHPSEDVVTHLSLIINKNNERIEECYRALCDLLQQQEIDHIVLVPHLVRGGADLAAIHLIKELSKAESLLVITTIDVPSPWIYLISDIRNVYVLEFYKQLQALDYATRMRLVLLIIKNWNISKLSIINSSIGYDLATEYAQELQPNTRVYLHTFAYDMTREGYLYNVLENGLVRAYEGTDMYITDSKYYKDELIKINGFNDEKVSELYLPISSKIRQKKDYSIKHKVLWASRISSAKLMDVAIKVGEELGKQGIELHMYGSMDLEYEKDGTYLNAIKPFNTIHYHGKYDGFDSIDSDQYDIFLLTSKNEGMPNVVIEAVASNLFVIAPAVGGVPEVIYDGINGFLVNKNFAYEEYLEKILGYYENTFLHDPQRRCNQNKIIVDRHSSAEYSKNVKKLYR